MNKAKLSGALLYNGDCLEVMDSLIEKGRKVDAVIMDPPYELKNHGGTNSELSSRAAKVRDEVEFMANGFDYENCFERILKICKVPNVVIFCSNQQISKIMSFFENKGLSTTLLTWKKSNPSPLCNGKYISDLEFMVYVRGKGAPWNAEAPINVKYKSKTYSIMTSKNKLHPTQKPLQLVEELVMLHTLEGQVVLDCFMGSGTTGVACRNLNRKFIGMELNKDYFDKAVERIKSIEEGKSK